jgi:hypothetical protein
MFETLAQELIKANAGKLGSVIGTAIGGPAGTAIGGMAGKAIEQLAEALGTAADPVVIAETIRKDTPATREVVAEMESRVADLLPLWREQVAMAAEAQRAEIERGFGSWNARRSTAHYVSWIGLAAILAGLLYAVFLRPDAVAPLTALLPTWITIVVMWTGVNSGGKAVTDAITAAKGGK